jgi:L-lactate dehydrogenase complex protein LldE
MSRTVDLFATCLVDSLYPQVGEAVVAVLERLGERVGLPEDQTCCGLPLYNNGYVEEARRVARHSLSVFRDDVPLVVPSGSCAWMLRHVYPELFPADTEEHEVARAFAARVEEFSEHVARARLPKMSLPQPRVVTYHASCHLLRGLRVEGPPRTLLASVDNLELRAMDCETECCGFGGTFSARYPDVSSSMLDKKLASAARTNAELVVLNDAGCMLQVDGGARRRGCEFQVKHLAEVLDEAMPR